MTSASAAAQSGIFWTRQSHQRVVPLRYKRRRTKPFKVSGRIPIQFRHAVFAADFRVPQDTGVPVLSNEELLFQSNSVREPAVSERRRCLSIPKRISRFELWEYVREWCELALDKNLGAAQSGVLWGGFALAMVYFWGCAALFSVGEWCGFAVVAGPIRVVDRAARPSRLDARRLLVDVRSRFSRSSGASF